jgi:hypothetical protein
MLDRTDIAIPAPPLAPAAPDAEFRDAIGAFLVAIIGRRLHGLSLAEGAAVLRDAAAAIEQQREREACL